MKQLCMTVCSKDGSVKEVIFRDKTSAIVMFARKSDAETAVDKFSQLALDGKPIRCMLTDESNQTTREPKNVKAGLFGTAFKDSSTTYSVTFGSGSGLASQPRSSRGVVKPAHAKPQFQRERKPVDLDEQLESYKKGKASKGAGGDGKKAFSKGGKKKEAVSLESLDSDFDSYLAKR